MSPERVVLLPPLDRDPECRPHDVRLEPLSVGKPPPPELLVDECLADVEHDRLQSHDSTSARSAGVVIMRSRGSPRTTATLPPTLCTMGAQSVALPSSCQNTGRSLGASIDSGG